MPRTDILLLDGESNFAPKVVRSLALGRRWRIHVLAAAGQPRCAALEWSRHVASFHAVPTSADAPGYLNEIRRVVRQTGAALVLPLVEPTILFCIRQRAALEAFTRLGPLPSEEAYATGIDKARLAAFMAARGIPHPVTEYSDAPGVARLRFPVLVKPRRACGGRGIVQLDTAAALQAELARREPGNSHCVQEYAGGHDLGCSVLARDGRIQAWTVQRGLRRMAPRFGAFAEVEILPCPPVLEAVKQLIAALHWSGVANLDLRFDPASGRALVLELNGRFWASLLASTAATVNFPDLACRLALGEPLPPSRQSDGRFVSARLLLRDWLQLRPRALRHPATDLWMLLRDPLPELIARINRRPALNRRPVETWTAVKPET